VIRLPSYSNEDFRKFAGRFGNTTLVTSSLHCSLPSIMTKCFWDVFWAGLFSKILIKTSYSYSISSNSLCFGMLCVHHFWCAFMCINFGMLTCESFLACFSVSFWHAFMWIILVLLCLSFLDCLYDCHFCRLFMNTLTHRDPWLHITRSLCAALI